MRTAKDVEAYLGRLNRRFDTVEGQDNTFLVHASIGAPTSESARMPPIALRVEPPLVVFRVHVGDAPKTDHNELFRKLLQLNAKSLVHTSFGLEDDRIVLCAALELENLDFNEVEATIDEIDLTLMQQVPVLMDLAKKND